MTTNLDTLRKTAEAATPGPWTRDGVGVLGAREDWDGGKGPARIMQAMMPWHRERMEANAEHVATFDPPTMLALLSRLEQAEQAVQRVREVAESSDDKHLTMAILEALDGGTRRLADDALTGRTTKNGDNK